MSSDPTLTAKPAGSSQGEPAISLRNVGKCYHIYDKPRDRLKQAALGKFRTFYRPFWALHDISMDIMPGESVGIVGRNGSGKSTLLQLIAGTLTPTTGEIRVRGRVAALLELGSGFNPDFTGRENVFLQGSILGIPRREMERKFDAIAAFADIGDFLDQPVKHYSSGMYARLAFSVAVSVDPEILIVDEILAVGDMAFQQRCIARMRALLDSGVTLLLVSHSDDNVKSLCRRALFLDGGRQQFLGSAVEAVDRDHHHVREEANRHAVASGGAAVAASEAAPAADSLTGLRYGTAEARIESVRILDDAGRPVKVYRFGEAIHIEMTIRAMQDVQCLDAHFAVRDSVGVDLFGTGTGDERCPIPPLHAGQRAVVRFKAENNLRPGSYGVTVTLTRPGEGAAAGGVTVDHISGAAAFAVLADASRPVRYKIHQAVEATCTLEAAPTPVTAPAPPIATTAAAPTAAGTLP
jgi:lipopolysaccharide transport system ATP-binding protein